IRVSDSSWLPLIAALTTAGVFIGLLGKWPWLAFTALLATLAVVLRWAWTTGDRHAPDRLEAGGGLALPIQYAAENAPGWWGLMVFLCADATAFAALLFGYLYLWLPAGQWPPAGIALPPWPVALLCALAATVAALATGRGREAADPATARRW